MRAAIQMLPDGRRLHMSDGPIDLLVEAFGTAGEIRAAYQAAARRFATVLDELCTELPVLRRPAFPDRHCTEGPVARRMERAVEPFAAQAFITPMAAVAGAVADEVLAAMVAAADLDRAYVNNGGDIALHLGLGQALTIGLIDRPDRPSEFRQTRIHATDAVRGVATSGWRGRSFSLGIADAVTVLAGSAAAADAAATIVANAVDLPGHLAITRRPACDLQPDSDLGRRLVTRDVGPLHAQEIEAALDAGAVEVARLVERGLVKAVALHLQGTTLTRPGTASHGGHPRPERSRGEADPGDAASREVAHA